MLDLRIIELMANEMFCVKVSVLRVQVESVICSIANLMFFIGEQDPRWYYLAVVVDGNKNVSSGCAT